MRQGQQNRRRGRNNSNNNNNNANNNRKPQNPLSRTYESSGPDVKIRGTAAQIAEKYMTLARDASSSGDTVTAENYLQHAEHYNRIIMAAQAQAQTSAPAGYHGAEGGHGLNGVHHRSGQDANGAMRDQPQPQLHPQSAPQPHFNPAPQSYDARPVTEEAAPLEQPEAAESKSEQLEAAKADDAKDQGTPSDQGRRRRRRYPGNANGTGRGASADANAGNGKAAEIASDARPSDEALA